MVFSYFTLEKNQLIYDIIEYYIFIIYQLIAIH